MHRYVTHNILCKNNAIFLRYHRFPIFGQGPKLLAFLTIFSKFVLCLELLHKNFKSFWTLQLWTSLHLPCHKNPAFRRTGEVNWSMSIWIWLTHVCILCFRSNDYQHFTYLMRLPTHCSTHKILLHIYYFKWFVYTGPGTDTILCTLYSLRAGLFLSGSDSLLFVLIFSFKVPSLIRFCGSIYFMVSHKNKILTFLHTSDPTTHILNVVNNKQIVIIWHHPRRLIQLLTQSVPNTFWVTSPNRQFIWFGLVGITKCIEFE